MKEGKIKQMKKQTEKQTEKQMEKQMDEKIKKYIKIKLKKHYKIIYVFLTIFILVSIYIIFFNKTSNVYLKSEVQNSDVMSLLMNEMSSMNSRISSEVGWIMTIVSIIMGAVGFYSYNQWKMSANQIDNLRKEFKDQFHIEFMQEKINEIQDNTAIQRKEIEKSKKINSKMLSELSKRKIETEKQFKDLEKFKKENIGTLMMMSSEELSLISKDEEETLVNMEIENINTIISEYKDVEINVKSFVYILANISNGHEKILNMKFKDEKEKAGIKEGLEKIDKYLLKKVDERFDEEDKRILGEILETFKGKVEKVKQL